VVRWIVYLRRIAALYARGRYSVRPLRATAAPSEIRDLAATIGAMAATIGARDAALKESLVAKDELMREIHHRVKNNLQVISSLLNLQQRTLVDPAAAAAMHDTRQRIIALGLIYRALYEGPDLKRVDFRVFLNELLAQLLVDHQGRGHSIRAELNIDPLIIDPDRLAPLALFIVEAITNACSHNFPDDEGVLSIAFSARNDEATLTISDTGNPVGADDRGHTMMAIFARQLGGVVTQAINPDGGATVGLTFPMRAESPIGSA
jgi:two-component sensor histidine kinase